MTAGYSIEKQGGQEVSNCKEKKLQGRGKKKGARTDAPYEFCVPDQTGSAR